jgi:hypothetical protein
MCDIGLPQLSARLIAQRRHSRAFDIGRTRQLDSVFPAENSPREAARGDVLLQVELTLFGAVIFIAYSTLTYGHPVPAQTSAKNRWICDVAFQLF